MHPPEGPAGQPNLENQGGNRIGADIGSQPVIHGKMGKRAITLISAVIYFIIAANIA